MQDDRPASIPALGLGLIFVGIFIVMVAGILFLVSMVIPEDKLPDIPDISYEDNPFVRLIQLNSFWGAMIVYGLLYIYAAIGFREFKRWAYHAIIALSALLVIITPAAMFMVFGGLPSSFDMSQGVTTFLGMAIPTTGLIWFLLSKQVRPHFTSSIEHTGESL